MATPKKKYEYQIQYTDQTSRIVEWNKEEFSLVSEAVGNEARTIVIDECIYQLQDIRAIVKLKEPEKPKKGKEEELSEWGGYDLETLKWLKDQGIDVTGGIN